MKKAVYNLKQSPRAWFEQFSNAMTSFGYRQSNVDRTLFIRHYTGKIILFIVYVDDIAVIGDDREEMSHLKNLVQ